MNVCFSRPSAPNEILDVTLYENVTVEELKKIVQISSKSVYIKTPFFCQKLENNIRPFIFYPELIKQNKDDPKYPIPSTCLIINESSTPEYSLFVSIKTQMEDIEFPFMEVKFTAEDLKKLNSTDFLLRCIKTFEFECYDTFLLDSDQKIIEKEISLKDLFEISQKSHLIFKCTIADSGIELIHKRKNVVKEFISSEVIFINNIQVLHDYWYPALLKAEIFDNNQLNLIFQEINPILKTHVDLLKQLSKSKSYSSEIGPLFLNFIDRFKVTIPFITNYKKADSMIQKKLQSSKNIEKRLIEIASNSPMRDGGDFSSYYITPVQRYPRYTLLIKELAKYTPSFHPDKTYLQLAEEALIIINREINETSQQIKQQLILNEIQRNLSGDFSIVKNNRVLMCKKKISIQKKLTVKKGVIYLFNDMVMIVKRDKKKKLKPVYFEKVDDFRFCNGLLSNDSILIPNKSNDVTITFKNFDKKSVWMEKFNQVRTYYASNFNSDSKFVNCDAEIKTKKNLISSINIDSSTLGVDKEYSVSEDVSILGTELDK